MAQVDAPADQQEPAGDGWYREDSYLGCHGSGPAARFTAGAVPPDGVIARLLCSDTQSSASDGTLQAADPSQCKLPSTSASHADTVGDACAPLLVPAHGFSDVTAYVEAGSDQCATGACLIYRLMGDTSPDCQQPSRMSSDGGMSFDVASCASTRDTEQRVYCSCRCDAPEGDPGPLCACGDGFSCVPTIKTGPPGIRGSYCVRDGTFILD